MYWDVHTCTHMGTHVLVYVCLHKSANMCTYVCPQLKAYVDIHMCTYGHGLCIRVLTFSKDQTVRDGKLPSRTRARWQFAISHKTYILGGLMQCVRGCPLGARPLRHANRKYCACTPLHNNCSHPRPTNFSHVCTYVHLYAQMSTYVHMCA